MLELNFHPFPVLKTKRLLLRSLTKDDAAEIYFLRSDEDVLRFIGKEPTSSLKEARKFIGQIKKDVSNNKNILWGIELRDDPGKIIGTICYWRFELMHYRAELGYVLHPEHWRKGIMKEAIAEVLKYGFGTMKLHSVEARISAGNEASGATLTSSGFTKDAYFKEDFYFRGRFFDTIVYSRLG
jgi:[ribosomal protein S5]-alanine N-acetyltransferase